MTHVKQLMELFVRNSWNAYTNSYWKYKLDCIDAYWKYILDSSQATHGIAYSKQLEYLHIFLLKLWSRLHRCFLTTRVSFTSSNSINCLFETAGILTHILIKIMNSIASMLTENSHASRRDFTQLWSCAEYCYVFLSTRRRIVSF